MKILMFGRGAIATIYGWALEQSGHDVEFLVRPGRAAQYGDSVDLDLLDARRRPWGERVVRTWPVRLREELAADHDVDLIVVSVGEHQLSAAAEFLAPRIGGATVLVFGNVWAEPAEAVAPLPMAQVAWGFPGGGGGFDDDGTLHGGLLRSVVLGTFGGSPTSREHAVRELFSSAGHTISEQSDIRGWLWAHAVANAGMHAQGLRLGSLSEMVGDRRSFRDALLTTRELLPLLRARGVDLRRHRTTLSMFRAPAIPTAALMAVLTAHVPLARSSLAAQSNPVSEEPRSIVRDVLREARRLGVPTPRLEAAGAHLM